MISFSKRNCKLYRSSSSCFFFSSAILKCKCNEDKYYSKTQTYTFVQTIKKELVMVNFAHLKINWPVYWFWCCIKLLMLKLLVSPYWSNIWITSINNSTIYLTVYEISKEIKILGKHTYFLHLLFSFWALLFLRWFWPCLLPVSLPTILQKISAYPFYYPWFCSKIIILRMKMAQMICIFFLKQ